MNIGIDVGGTNLKAGLVDEQGTIVHVCREAVGMVCSGEDLVNRLAELARKTAGQAGAAPSEIRSVGIGIPGAVEDGRIVYTCNLPIKDIPASRLFRQSFDVPVLLGNDADCAAVGEYFCGAGRGTRDFLVVTLGTGIGGGMIFDGKLYRGMGLAGEVGHMVVEKGGLSCSCGRQGCWETYASATGLIRMTREAMKQNPESLMHTVENENGTVDGRTAFQAATRDDAAARAVCGRYVSYLAAGIINLVNVLHPEKLAIGGGVSAAPTELLLNPLRELVQKECYARHGGKETQIVPAELGNDAGIIGAALLRRAIS